MTDKVNAPQDKGTSSGPLSDEEITEFRRLRKEEADRKVAQEKAAKDEEDARPANSHWLHLANGDVIESAGVTTNHRGIAVIGAYPITEKEEEAGK